MSQSFTVSSLLPEASIEPSETASSQAGIARAALIVSSILTSWTMESGSSGSACTISRPSMMKLPVTCAVNNPNSAMKPTTSTKPPTNAREAVAPTARPTGSTGKTGSVMVATHGRHLTRLEPALQLALDNMQKHADAAIAVVEAGDVGEVLAAVRKKDLLVLLGDLFERLEAIGGKARRENSDPLHTIAGQRLDGLVGIGLQPLGASEAGLEGVSELGAERPERLGQALRGQRALREVRIALLDIALGQSMIGSEDRLRLPVEPGKMRCDRVGQRRDINGIGGIDRYRAQRRLTAHRLQHIENLVVHARRGRSRILRVEREHEQAVAALRANRLDTRGDARIAVAHRPVDYDICAHLEGRRNFFALRAGDGAQG